VQRIESIDDPRVAAYRNLRDRTLRGEQIFVAEGRLLVLRLLASRYEAESVFVAEELAGEFQQAVAGRVPLYVASKSLLREVSGFPFHRGALAAGRRGEPATLEQLLGPANAADRLDLIVCPQITQPENLGLVFRTAAAFGLDGVLLGQRSCDPFARRSLRLSMGGALQIPFVRSRDILGDLARLKTRWGVTLVAAVVDQQAEPLPQFSWPPRTALLLGHEFEGLDADSLALCDRRVTIPMRPGTDSLNLGVAAGVFLYQMQNKSSGRLKPEP
jgi:tRNA G18 (ribose-2'-O)-methylase SpoU